MSTYKEPSDAELLSFMDQFPLLPGFTLLQTYILPISVQEVWDNYYADVSFFYSSEATAETVGEHDPVWHDPEPYYKTFEGIPVL